MGTVSMGVLLIVLAIASIPVVLALFFAAYLWEKAHGGSPVNLCKGCDLESLMA